MKAEDRENKFTFTDTRTGEVISLLGDDEKVAAEKIEEVMRRLKPRDQQRLMRRLTAEQRRLEADIRRKRERIDILAAEKDQVLGLKTWLDAWYAAPFRLERPPGSAAHRAAMALREGRFLLAEPAVSELRALPDFSPVSLVVEHDWAGALERATDFDTGEFRQPFDDCLFEFRISGVPVCVYSREDRRICLIEHGDDWCAVGMDPNDNDEGDRLFALLRAQLRAVCIALDAEVAVTDVVRAPERLNRQRERRGAAPILDYHVIRLNRRERAAPLPQDADAARKHRSPRLHFVRGHWRHYDDHRTWIRWHMRGDPDLGFIDKHYRL